MGRGISNPTPYQARRPPLGMRFTLKHNINVAFGRHAFHIIIIRSNLLAAGKIILRYSLQDIVFQLIMANLYMYKLLDSLTDGT